MTAPDPGDTPPDVDEEQPTADVEPAAALTAADAWPFIQKIIG